MKNSTGALIDDERAMSEQELEQIYAIARRLAQRPRNVEEREKGGPVSPGWWLAAIMIGGFYLTLVILLIRALLD